MRENFYKNEQGRGYNQTRSRLRTPRNQGQGLTILPHKSFRKEGKKIHIFSPNGAFFHFLGEKIGIDF